MNLSLLPYFLAYALAGGILSSPGAVMDLLLNLFAWTPRDFGLAMTCQGICTSLGTLAAAHLVPRIDLRVLLRHALVMLIVGMSAFYFADVITLPGIKASPIRFLGAAITGFAFGFTIVVNNMRALVSPNLHAAMSWLQMGFTLGATCVPLILGPWRSYAKALIEGGANAALWRLPLLGMVALAIFLLGSVKLCDPTQPDTFAGAPSASDSRESSTSPLLPALTAAALLFFYVGIEINLSNGILVFVKHLSQPANTVADWAAGAFWLGLLGARIIAALRTISPRHHPKRLASLAVATTVCIGILASGATAGSPHLTLLLIAATGGSLGAIYSLGISIVSLLYSERVARVRAHHVVTLSSFGTILLPLLFGAVWARLGIAEGMIFIAALSAIMTACAFALQRLPLHEIERSASVTLGAEDAVARIP